MIITTRALTLAALSIAPCVGVMEMIRNGAQAAEPMTMTRIDTYSAARVDTAFDLVEAMPASAPFMVSMAQKRDLLIPPGCMDTDAEAQAECRSVAYKLPGRPGIVIETRDGTTTTLMRMDAMTVAGTVDESQLQNE